ncbi:LysR family transcriptional regulator [Salidesulfovibrio onnuriiensis]|uniref:LysR family transcriptional regulator n=1 Tax=Salidesulfovibrio onnuriiensis TaxID=2583823 RepID=UPI0011C720E4|nr:LysR family transcriptional regulator [Salidesulfovibrio onnuriiensis]
MEFRKIQLFVEVVRQQGFARAAAVACCTQSAVSKAVRQLEDEVGVPLLNRGGKGGALTAAGEAVYARGLRMLAERDDLLEEIDAIRGIRKGRLSVGIPRIGSSTLFAPIFALYRERYPDIDIRLVEHGADRLREALHTGEVELAASLLPVSGEYRWHSLRREPLAALVPCGSPLAGGGSVCLADLKDMPFILFAEGFSLNRIIVDACRRSGFEPRVVARSSQIRFICELVAAGLGVAFLPRMVAERRRVPGLDILPLAEEHTDWHTAVIWREGTFLSHAAAAWLEVVRELYPGGREGVS